MDISIFFLFCFLFVTLEQRQADLNAKAIVHSRKRTRHLSIVTISEQFRQLSTIKWTIETNRMIWANLFIMSGESTRVLLWQIKLECVQDIVALLRYAQMRLIRHKSKRSR